MAELDFVKYLSKDTDPQERERSMEGYEGHDPYKERPDLGLGYRIMGRVMEWAQPKKALEDRKQFYGEQLKDPAQATMMFGPGAMTRGQVSKAFRKYMAHAPRGMNLGQEFKAFQKWVPEGMWKQLKSFQTFTPEMRPNVQGLYRRASMAGGAQPESLAGKAFLGTASADPAATAAHEVAGHGVFDTLRNWSGIKSKPVLSKTLEHLRVVHRGAYNIRAKAHDAIRKLDKRRMVKGELTGAEEEVRGLLHQYATDAHSWSPEEQFSEAMKGAWRGRQDFNVAVKENLMDVFRRRVHIKQQLDDINEGIDMLTGILKKGILTGGK